MPTLCSIFEALSVKSRPLWQEAQLVAPLARPVRVAANAVRPRTALTAGPLASVRVPSALR